MKQQPMQHFLRYLVTIFLIAVCAMNMPAIGQNASQNNQRAQEQALDTQERTRVNAERVRLNRELAEQRKACYQKLSVTACLNAARDQHNEQMRDLKRQEVALNDAKRKSAAADRQRAMDERNSPEAQLKRAQDRGRAMEAAAKREEGQAQREADRKAKLEAANKKPIARPSEAKASPEPKGQPRSLAEPKLKPEQRSGQAAIMEKNRQQSAEREKAADMRRAEALQREAKRKKPAAAPLPLPD
jgi:colicin import membrane protein